MKTTNFEISKKLKEAGFEDSYIYAWYSDSEGLPWIQEIQHAKPTAVNKYREEVKLTFTAPAYDLETLLDALPDSITREYKSNKDGTIKEFEEKLLINKSYIWYRCYDIGTTDEANEYWLEYGYKQNISIYHYYDSLANIAGKMLIKLFEAGLIKFNK